MASHNKKILIDAVFINNSGGYVLLDYLINEIEKLDLPVVYLLDYRIKERDLIIKRSNKIVFLNNSLMKRLWFYFLNRNSFLKVLCFGNIPPSIKINAIVFTYFHQLNYLSNKNELGFFNNLIFSLKKVVFNSHIKLTDFWIVQTQFVKDELLKKYKVIPNSNVHIIPFYPSLVNSGIYNKQKDSYLYVSSGFEYKNHLNLLSAFCLFFDQFKRGILYVTISAEFKTLYNYISDLVDKGYPIINIGNVDRESLYYYYSICNFLVYPSKIESLGLGVLEGIENNCYVLGPDLPWLHSVCEPSLVFDPNTVSSILEVLESSIQENLMPSRQLAYNKIDDLIKLLLI